MKPRATASGWEHLRRLPDFAITRRRFITYFPSVGLSSTLLPGVLWARVQEEKAERITTAITLTPVYTLPNLHSERRARSVVFSFQF